MKPPAYANRPRPSWSTRPPSVVRTWTDENGNSSELELVPVGDTWHAEVEIGFGSQQIAIPGARAMTVAEHVKGRLRRTQRYGTWIEVSKEVAHAHPEALTWCRKFCNSELPSGGFRFSPSVWEARASDPLDLPFVPELDHDDPITRELARVERFRRIAELEERSLRGWRDRLVLEATQAGYSRRQIAQLLGLSFGRVQQVVDVGRGSQRQASGAPDQER